MVMGVIRETLGSSRSETLIYERNLGKRSFSLRDRKTAGVVSFLSSFL